MPGVRRILLLARQVLGAALLAALLGAQAATAQDLPAASASQERAAGGVVAPDPAVVFGELPNGMRYALMPNRTPPGAVAIRFVVKAGSLQEHDDEGGLVHFIEHMAFNGSRNVPEGDMVKTLERLGLAFGADANATTSRTETAYMFDLPAATPTAIDQSLFLLREIASELAFDPGAIARERGVILAEQRRGETFETRRAEDQLQFLIPDAFVTKRPPIGEKSVIETASRERLVSLYNRLYRPDQALLVIVGDIDPAVLQGKIALVFGDWTPKAGKQPDHEILYPLTPRAPEAFVWAHPDGGDSIAVYQLLPFERLTDDVPTRQEAWRMNAAMGILTRRLSRLAEGAAPPFRRASIGYYDIWDAVDVVSLSAAISPGAWQTALESLEQEWRRAGAYGFSEQEVADQIAWMRTGFRQAVERRETRTTSQLATQILGSLLDNTVFADPAAELEEFEAWASATDVGDIHDAFVRRFKLDRPLFLLATSVPQPNAIAHIPRAWTSSAQVAVSAPLSHNTTPFAYTDFGTPGQVVKDERLKDIDARLVTFGNNVQLNIKRTLFQANTVRVSLRVGEGALSFETAPHGLSSLMSAYVAGGLELHTVDELRSLMSGRIVQAGFSVLPDAFGGSYTTTPGDLEFQLQLLAAFMLHPGYREEAERRWREAVVLSWPRLGADAQSVFSSQGVRQLMSGDRRFGSDPADGVTERSFAEFRTYLEPVLRTGAIEIAVVGDVPEDEVIAVVARTFGALPARSPTRTMVRSPRPVQFRPSGQPLVLTHGGEPSQAMVQIYWPVDVDPDANPQEVRTLTVLGSVMRLKIVAQLREELGASYAPSAGASVSGVYPGLGYLYAGAEVSPEHIETAAKVIHAIADDLREGRISSDELQRAVQPSLEQLAAHASENGYWLAVLAEAQSRLDRLGRQTLAAVEASIRAVTLDDLVAAASTWMLDTNAREIRIVPKQGG